MIIFRYLCKELYSSLLAITLVLLIIFITNQFIHYLKDAASGQITMTAVMQIMSLQIPLLLGYLLPLGLYLSILISYGRLYVDHEMTVLSSCGMSRAQLMGMTTIIALAVMFIVAALMLWVEPMVQGYRTRILDEAITNASIQKIVPKRFQVLKNHQVLYADQVSREDQTLYHFFMAKPSLKDRQWDVTLSATAK
ncbi:MAG: LptF/LptG family permease, partial [Coxiellaceae bacterium]|nr:LptF/LptG family permease [Coxiellaceae bacterium]